MRQYIKRVDRSWVDYLWTDLELVETKMTPNKCYVIYYEHEIISSVPRDCRVVTKRTHWDKPILDELLEKGSIKGLGEMWYYLLSEDEYLLDAVR